MNTEHEIKVIKTELRLIRYILAILLVFSMFSFIYRGVDQEKNINIARANGVYEAKIYTDSCVNEIKVEFNEKVMGELKEIKTLITGNEY